MVYFVNPCCNVKLISIPDTRQITEEHSLVSADRRASDERLSEIVTCNCFLCDDKQFVVTTREKYCIK